MIKPMLKLGNAPDPRIDLYQMQRGDSDALRHARRAMDAYYGGDLAAFLDAYGLKTGGPAAGNLMTHLAAT